MSSGSNCFVRDNTGCGVRDKCFWGSRAHLHTDGNLIDQPLDLHDPVLGLASVRPDVDSAPFHVLNEQ